MALTWKWDEKCGEATFKRKDGYTYTVNLYVGNAFLITLYEYKENGEDRYSLDTFFLDEDHMRRCLENEIFTKYSVLTAITINKAKCRNYKKIVALLAEYMDDIDIRVYKDGEYTWKEYAEPKPIIPDERMREIAEEAMSYILDRDLMPEFLEDRYLDLDKSEMDYFGVDYEEDDDYDE